MCRLQLAYLFCICEILLRSTDLMTSVRVCFGFYPDLCMLMDNGFSLILSDIIELINYLSFSIFIVLSSSTFC